MPHAAEKEVVLEAMCTGCSQEQMVLDARSRGCSQVSRCCTPGASCQHLACFRRVSNCRVPGNEWLRIPWPGRNSASLPGKSQWQSWRRARNASRPPGRTSPALERPRQCRRRKHRHSGRSWPLQARSTCRHALPSTWIQGSARPRSRVLLPCRRPQARRHGLLRLWAAALVAAALRTTCRPPSPTLPSRAGRGKAGAGGGCNGRRGGGFGHRAHPRRRNGRRQDRLHEAQ